MITSPAVISTSSSGRNARIRSSVSTMITTMGRSSDSGRMRVVWMWFDAPVALGPPEHGRARHPRLVCALHDLGGQGSVAVVVGLTDEDGEAPLVSFELHRRPPRWCGRGTIRAAQMPAHT